jgi:hypothetical protein
MQRCHILQSGPPLSLVSPLLRRGVDAGWTGLDPTVLFLHQQILRRNYMRNRGRGGENVLLSDAKTTTVQLLCVLKAQRRR